MTRKISSILTVLALCLLLLGSVTETAHAGDLDRIHSYEVTVTPNEEDASLAIQVHLEWEVLAEGPVSWVQVGIPNGSIRQAEALSSNIDYLDYDNQYMYIYFTEGYDDGEVIDFTYRWVQEYMYTLADDGQVYFDYTPGWFDEIQIDEMSLTWMLTPGLTLADADYGCDRDCERIEHDDSFTVTARDLLHGDRMHLWTSYAGWPTELYWEYSSENLPEDYPEDSSDDVIEMIIFVVVVLVVIQILARSIFSYRGGFGATRYVLYHGLWYPAGRNGKPRPGSTGTRRKPKPGGLGGGSRGGGFGGSGFGGGSHCACASSCACACACACAGGGRAGCSAKNLYGAVKLSRELCRKFDQ